MTWDRKNQKLIFMKNMGIDRQLWFFKKGQKGFNIMSAADRSKVLDYDIEKPHNLIPIQIATLDEVKDSQYFLLREL
ncbi:hypothetical protein PYL81_09020 [Paenibacillus larvae subsp. larvae]|uniref:hypothetical protein n=1 Tax=Paenibacillus larvae TaxID=1464 RepID=UPI0023A9E76A|nr:hypothetical protein [Paenibacillus larvae]MDE5160858.1 hypothetical protein [Paenibacillus larvae subsp. larvae]